MSHPSIGDALEKLARDQELRERLAYARVHYFGEEEMARKFGLA
jgi:hypothetical protein